MNNDLARDITSALNIKEVMEFYGVRFNPHDFAKCPFHTEKTASLSIKNDHYKCFGCGAYGGIIDFVMNYYGLRFMQAIMKLNNDFQLGLTVKKPTYRERQQMAENRRIEEAVKKFKLSRKRYYNGIAVFHREVFRRLCEKPGDAFLVDLQKRLEQYLEENNEEVVQPWQ